MKKILILTLLLAMLVLTGCIDKEAAEPVKPGEIFLNEMGVGGKIHDLQPAWEIMDLQDFDVWVIYIKKDRLSEKLRSSMEYAVTVNGKDYFLKANPFNSNILKLVLPANLKPEELSNIIIKTKNTRNNGMMKNDISLAIENIYIRKEENNGTQLNEISIDTYTDLYADIDKTNFAYENEQFIRPSHVKSNEENTYTVNTYFDARTVATTESATGAFQFLKNVEDYEQYIIMENPNRFRENDGATQLLAPDTRWRIRQLGDMGELDDNNVFNIEDDPINNQFTLSIDTDTLPPTYTGTFLWLAHFQEATRTQFEESERTTIMEMIIPYSDAPSTELVLNARFQGVDNKILRFNETGEFQDSYSVLNTAVGEANNKDIIKIVGGTVVSPTNEHATIENQVIITSKTLTLTSTTEEPVILDAQQTFPILGANFANLTLEKLRFINGIGSKGGGLGMSLSTVHIQACKFASNTVNSGIPEGGAIYAVESTLTLENSTLTNNTAGYGGGIYAEDSPLTIHNVTITNNNGFEGAGLYAEDSPLTINHSSFRSNENQSGGTVYITSDSPSTITHSTFKDNVAVQYAAGIYMVAPVENKGHLMVDNCLFDNNQLTTDQTIYPNGLAAGIRTKGLPRGSVISDSVFKDMEARQGAGILNEMGNLTIYNNIFENLNVTEAGAAIYTFAGSIFNNKSDEWRVFNSPAADVEFVENTTEDLNTYSNCTINNNPTQEGAQIAWSMATTADGNLQIVPETATGNTGEKITIKATCTMPQNTYDASLTFIIPAEMVITTDASVAVGQSDKRPLTATEIKDDHTVLLTGITNETNGETIVFDFIHRDGLSSGGYDFSMLYDADGSGTLYTPSEKAEDSLTIPSQYGAPQVAVKTPVSGTELATTTVNFTWEATPGNHLNPTSNREEQGISHFVLAFANGDNQWVTATIDESEDRTYATNTLSYGQDYNWYVKALGVNGKTTTTTPLATFKTKYRLMDLGNEGEAETDVFYIEDHPKWNEYVVNINIAKLPDRFEGATGYKLTVKEKKYVFSKNNFDPNLYNATITYESNDPTLEDIRESFFECYASLNQNRQNQKRIFDFTKPMMMLKRDTTGIEMRSLYISKGEELYEITLPDYLSMKTAPTDFVYSNGKLIRPTHIRSNEGYAYTMKNYYDARQASNEHTAESAFGFLKEREDHVTQLVYTQNPYKAKKDGDDVKFVDPDTRQRVWQLGNMGMIDESTAYTYNILNDSQAQQLRFQINENNLPESYEKTHLYGIQFWEESTICTLNQVSPGIYEGVIEYATTSNMDLVKNARFTEYPRPITLYSSTGEIKEKYIHMNEAVEAAEDGEVIKVMGGSVLHESTQSYITNKELTITSEDGMYTLDYTGAETTAFYLTGTASLTIEKAVVQNVCTTDQDGGAFYGHLFTDLTIKNTVIGTNTTVNGKGGGLCFMGKKFNLEESTITNNSAQDGGGVYVHSNATITNCTFLENHSTSSGGGVYNTKILYFYNNILDSNTADIGGNGLFIKTNATVYNSEGEQWRHFNAPDCPVNIIEKMEVAENIYKSHGNDEGAAIMHEEKKESTLGRLSLSPSSGTEGEKQILDNIYTLGTYFNDGCVKFSVDENFPITDTASVTIGDASPVNASTYSPNANIITITDINGEADTTVTLTILATIPPASTQAKYFFSAISDPDGTGSAWEYSDADSKSFTSESKD
ncbi:MAG: hypothetical protein U9N62_07425 [Thermotogota bacterium]|nr:hypothetical protein [Thermotogota bacterium]